MSDWLLLVVPGWEGEHVSLSYYFAKCQKDLAYAIEMFEPDRSFDIETDEVGLVRVYVKEDGSGPIHLCDQTVMGQVVICHADDEGNDVAVHCEKCCTIIRSWFHRHQKLWRMAYHAEWSKFDRKIEGKDLPKNH